MSFGTGATGDTARLIVEQGALANFGNNGTYGIGSIEGAGTFCLCGSALTVGSLNFDTTVAGPITDGNPALGQIGGTLTKVGAGRLALDGTNTYTGLTTVADGILSAHGSVAGDAVVKSGATLAGTGVLGHTTVESGGHLAPGDSPGTIALGGLTLQSGSFLDFEIGPTASDRVNVNGNLSLGGTLIVSLLDAFIPANGQSFPLFGGAIASVTGAFESVQAPLINGQTLNLVYSGTELTLQFGPASLPGDYNHDSRVDAADYTVWRDGLGTTYTQDDYVVWKAHFGETVVSGSSAPAVIPESSLAVPEPDALLLAGAAGLIFLLCDRGLPREFDQRQNTTYWQRMT